MAGVYDIALAVKYLIGIWLFVHTCLCPFAKLIVTRSMFLYVINDVPVLFIQEADSLKLSKTKHLLQVKENVCLWLRPQ